jgi:transposase InsO family protein
MNSVELAKIAKISQQSISKKTSKAISDGLEYIEIGQKRYTFSKKNGRYHYEELVREVKIQLSDDAEERKYLTYPVEKRKEAELRLALVREYERRPEGMSYKKFMDGLPLRFRRLRFSQRQFMRWVKHVRECPPEKTPLLYLVDKRGVRSKNKGVTKEMEDAIVRMILERPHRKAKRIYEYLLKDFAEVPSYETIRKWIVAWKEREYFVYAFATNPDKAKGMYKPAGGSMSEAVNYCNQLWELDATPADVICSDGKRYTISAAIDVYSRRPVVVVEESANYSTLAKVMRKAIKKLGVPEEVKVDNGQDYTSNYFEATCRRLRINMTLCPPFSGEYKPHIERFFGTLSRELFEEIDGYIGHNVAQREALQSQQQFSKKLESIKAWKKRYKDGNEFARRFAVKKENAGLDVGVPLSKEELQLWIDKWVVMYENRRHGGIKATPMQRWKRDVSPVRTIDDDRTLDILLGISTTRTIRKKGIEWHGITYWSELFGDMVGQKVWVLSDDDLSSIYVYDLEMNYLCTAKNLAYENVSRSSFLQANKKWNKKLAKTIKALEELRAEAPDRMMERINSEIGIDLLADIQTQQPTSQTLERLQESVDVIVDAKETQEADIRINGRPAFSTKHERFLWDLEHDRVDKGTLKLSEKYPDIWEMAKAEFERRRCG